MTDAPDPQDDAVDQLMALKARGAGLTPWELEFCTSLTDQLEKGRTLSQKQLDTLTSVYSKRVPVTRPARPQSRRII